MDKKALSERDICTKFISPAIERAGWDMQSQLREEVYITNGRIMVRGRITKRAAGKRVDYILYYKPNIPVAIIEAMRCLRRSRCTCRTEPRDVPMQPPPSRVTT